MKNNISVDDVLLAKYFAGEANPEEAMAVSDWLEVSQENRNQFHESEKVWSLGKGVSNPAMAKELAWKDLQNSFQEKRGLNFYFKIAASILLAVSAGLTIYFLNRPAEALAWETKSTQNEVSSLTLPDSSVVTMNRGSTLKWVRNFGDSTRKIELTGEAFFDVAHDESRPFLVETEDVKLKVLGTAFNVMTTDTSTVAEVIRGKVMMYTSKQQIIIEAGRKGEYDRESGKLRLIELKNKNDVAYATHDLVFESETLKEICNQLSKAYGVKFTFENERVTHCMLTSEYNDKSLSFIMDLMSETLGFKYEIKGTSVYIWGDGCY
jgi:ferric-dicitrate binding protein FerR (iron transport regulator)